MLINFDLMYKMLSSQGPASEKHLSTCLGLSAAMKLLGVKLIFKYFAKQGCHYEFEKQPWTYAAVTPERLHPLRLTLEQPSRERSCAETAPAPKSTDFSPLLPIRHNCMSTAWISSHFCKCKSQVNPLRRGLNSGNRERARPALLSIGTL